ncbi:MAG: TetR/AcrR family transcriptional regulator [Devosiaceae bacterium]|nr:TetR/AcrR family transcriptional regulator [Devosiaceae bacterium MH13]
MALAHSPDPVTDAAFTERQAAVLEVALNLLVEGGDKALTTAGLAKAANCSKESLYKWFGDREGILSAIVTYQASKVRGADERANPTTKEDFKQALSAFSEDLLAVLLSETSLALNRLSIGQVRGEAARGESAGLGAVLVDRGKRRIEARAIHLLTHGKRQRFITFDDAADAYTTLYGLIIGDLHIRALLGDHPDLDDSEHQARTRAAIDRFLTLFANALD